MNTRRNEDLRDIISVTDPTTGLTQRLIRLSPPLAIKDFVVEEFARKCLNYLEVTHTGFLDGYSQVYCGGEHSPFSIQLLDVICSFYKATNPGNIVYDGVSHFVDFCLQ